MTLIIAHGLPKSGSTFLFQVAKDVAASINGFPYNKAKTRFFPGMDIPGYVHQPADSIIEPLLRLLPPKASFVLKTHGRMTPLIASGIQSGSIKALVSFRDPRDAVVSMLDAGISDREKGKERGFSLLYKADDALKPLKNGWGMARDWAFFPGVLAIPYLLTATNQDCVIRLICTHLRAGHCVNEIRQRYAEDKAAKITEFHKGVADRFLEALTPEDIVRVTQSLESEIAESDALTARWMRAYGFGALFQDMHDRRQSRLDGLTGSRKPADPGELTIPVAPPSGDGRPASRGVAAEGKYTQRR
ncbi:MAG: hypothetical protein H0X27_02660 [Caulobacteraceae bacterium]|nr:hypothetical protein [Caulobacteraceae bacterium]